MNECNNCGWPDAVRSGHAAVLHERVRDLESEKAALEAELKEAHAEMLRFEDMAARANARAEQAEADLAAAIEHIHSCPQFIHNAFLKRAAGRESGGLQRPGLDVGNPVTPGSPSAAKPAARCADCDGMGRNLAHPEEPCPACGGSGRLVVRLNREQAKAFFKVLSDASVADPDDERECAG